MNEKVDKILEASVELTPESKKLFLDLCHDYKNWGGSPVVEITSSQRGNYTDLKKKGLVNSIYDTVNGRTVEFAQFTSEGKQLAKELGIEL